MIAWPLSDNLTASLISGTVATTLAIFAFYVKKSLKRDDAASAGLTAQIGGWKELVNQIREYADDLDERLERATADCDRRVAAVEKEMRWRDEQCQVRLAELEKKLAAIG